MFKNNLREETGCATFLALCLFTTVGCMSFHPGPLPGEPKDATFLKVAGTRTHYIDAPPKTEEPKGTVVLIHGFGASLTEWAQLIPVLNKEGWRVVALDLRGHGWSGRPNADYSIDAQAQLVLALLDELKIARFAVVGHSWGSAVALQIVNRAPARVTRVALYNGMFFNDQQPVVFQWARVPLVGEFIVWAFYHERADERMAFAFYDPEKHVTEDIVERLSEYIQRPGTLAMTLAGIQAIDYEALELVYPSIQQPVLLLWGREDEVTPFAYGERLANMLPNARLKVVPRCGHLPMVEVPTVTSTALVRFLGEGKP